MKAYKNRKIDPNKKVRVYRNLTKDVFSLVQGNLVVAHAKSLCLKMVTTTVREGGRQRVIATGRKNVHAWFNGYIDRKSTPRSRLRVKYNPVKSKHFWIVLDSRSAQRFVAAKNVWFDYPGCYITNS